MADAMNYKPGDLPDFKYEAKAKDHEKLVVHGIYPIFYGEYWMGLF